MSGRINAVTWAVLDAYAQTVEGEEVSGLREHLRREAPITRLKNTARISARGIGAFDDSGHLTPRGLMAARAAVGRLGFAIHGGTGEP